MIACVEGVSLPGGSSQYGMQDGTPVDEPSYLDPATTEFIGHFKRDFKLHGVPDVSGQFDHRQRALKATAGYSAVYVTHLARPGAQSIQVSPTPLPCLHGIDMSASTSGVL